MGDNIAPGFPADLSLGNAITANRIYGNQGQAIDLASDGVTANSASPRQGPNDFQNFPIIAMITDDRLQGALWGSVPDTPFHIEFFASSAYGPGGSGEAEDFLGAIEVKTDATGQALFTVPFSAPAGLLILTATATDPQGNTSEVTAPRPATLSTPPPSLRAIPNRALVFSAASGDRLAIQDAGAGPLGPDPVWSLTLSVSAGTLSLPTTAGLTGSGDGTGSLSYRGPLSALDAALDGLAFTPPVGAHVYATLAIEARSPGAPPQEAQLSITDGVFVVNTTTDGGPGSLRQAILDADTVTAGAVAIHFAMPGAGVRTIGLSSPLPAITTSLLVDGTTQPGYAGMPLIAFATTSTWSPLVIADGEVTLSGLAMQSVALEPTTTAQLIAGLEEQGVMSPVSLLDSRGDVVVQSQGVAPGDANDWISEHLAAGAYSLAVSGLEGTAAATWTIMLRQATAPFADIPAGADWQAILAGDFNVDGRPDLAVTGLFTGTVSVLLGDGDGTFQPPVTYAVGSSPGRIVAGDFSGDGRLDLAVANSGDGTVSVLLGDGDGTFRPRVTYAVGSGPGAMVAADFSGDGHLDLAVANTVDNTVSVLLGDGDGTFRPRVTYAVGSGPAQMVAGDFSGDGRLDLAVAEGGYDQNYNPLPGDVSILLGDGDGSFQPQVIYAVGSGWAAMVAGDFSGDGRLDLAVANSADGTVSVLLGNSDGTFRPRVTYAVGPSPATMVAGDFNGDGRLDLAIGRGEGTISMLLGDGDGTFQLQPNSATIAGNVGAMVAGDFNGDGRLDLIVNTSMLLGDGDGTFQLQVTSVGRGTLSTGSYPYAMVAGDFNGDGRLDLAVALEFEGTMSVLLGNSDGSFQSRVSYAVGGLLAAIVTADFNGDGRLDLVVGTGDATISVLLGDGDGTFQPRVSYAVGSATFGTVAGDFNGDGRLDLAMTGLFTGTVSVLLGDGDGTFQPPVTYAVGSSPGSVVAEDFNGDGHLDLAVANGGDNTISVLLGDGNGAFRPQVTYAVGSSPAAMVAGDFSGDGRLDLAVANYFGDTMSMLLGNGDGTFRPQVTYAVGVEPDGIVAGDFNGDGRLDLAVANQGSPTTIYAGSVSVLLSNGDGAFRPQVTSAVGSYATGIVAGDFSRDGRLDLAVANTYDGTVSVLLGNSDGTFSAPGQSDITPAANPVVADVNGDGTNDVLVLNGAGEILYRQGIAGQGGTFEPPVAINPGDPSRDIAWVPNTRHGPRLASVDAHDDAIALYAWRNGGFDRIESLATGRLPAQIIEADLNGNAWDDLVVRNAGDGTLTVFFNNGLGSFFTGFLPFSPVTLTVGLGASDVQAIDTTGGGYLDLVVTNKLTGQVSVLLNLGNRSFAAPTPYRAGTGLSEIDSSSSPEVTSLEATSGVAAGVVTPGGPIDLVTINPGSNTLDVLAGLGGGRFANPTTIQSKTPDTIVRTPGMTGNGIVRMADFTGNGIDDLAVLNADGLRILLGDGKGGFLPPTTYSVPSQADGLTLADLLGNGKLDLLVGDAYGDVLVLIGNGDGTFSPYHNANQAIALAVADLTGDGSKDVIYANQGLDRVVVDYGAGNSSVLADRSTGLLQPGAVTLADLNFDGISDLIVANSGSNNVLIYPGLANGQFGPAVNGGNGYFVGTNPVGVTVADLTGGRPDLVVADKGSNQVSILLNQSQQGGPIVFSAGPRLNSGGSGPVSTVVGHFTAGPFPDLLVTNSGSNNVTLLSGVGQGFFNDRSPRVYSVGSNPVTSFVGNFDGQLDLVTVNAGSNTLTVISGFEGPSPVVSAIASGGVNPTTAFAFASGNGFDDLVVGNSGDGVLALFEGGFEGLSLVSIEIEPNVPDPTALAFSALTSGEVQFYAATAGRESAELVALSLSIPIETVTSLIGSVPEATSVQLVALQETSLPLVATVLTLTIPVSGEEPIAGPAESEALGVVATVAGAGTSAGQGPISTARGGGATTGPTEEADVSSSPATTAPAGLELWERLVLGLDEALEELDREGAGVIMGPSEPADRPEPSPGIGAPSPVGGPGLRSAPARPSDAERDRREVPDPATRNSAIDAAVSWLDRSATGRLRFGGRSPLLQETGWRGRFRPALLGRKPHTIRTGRTASESGETEPSALGPGKDESGLAAACLTLSLLATRGLADRPVRFSIRRRNHVLI